MAGDGARVDAADADDAVADERVVERLVGAPVRHDARGVAHDVARHPDAARLGVLVVHAGVADVRRGLQHDLAGVRGVGEGLLVAGHAGGEDDLAERRAARAVGAADVAGAVLEHEDGGVGVEQRGHASRSRLGGGEDAARWRRRGRGPRHPAVGSRSRRRCPASVRQVEARRGRPRSTTRSIATVAWPTSTIRSGVRTMRGCPVRSSATPASVTVTVGARRGTPRPRIGEALERRRRAGSSRRRAPRRSRGPSRIAGSSPGWTSGPASRCVRRHHAQRRAGRCSTTATRDHDGERAFAGSCAHPRRVEQRAVGDRRRCRACSVQRTSPGSSRPR